MCSRQQKPNVLVSSMLDRKKKVNILSLLKLTFLSLNGLKLIPYSKYWKKKLHFLRIRWPFAGLNRKCWRIMKGSHINIFAFFPPRFSLSSTMKPVILIIPKHYSWSQIKWICCVLVLVSFKIFLTLPFLHPILMGGEN